MAQDYLDSTKFRPFLDVKHEGLVKHLCRSVYLLIESKLKERRKRLHKDKILIVLRVLLVNLYSAHYTHQAEYLSISRAKSAYDKSSRYSNDELSYSLVILLLDVMEEVGLLSEQAIGFYDKRVGRGFETRVKASRSLKLLLKNHIPHSLSLIEKEHEVIILRTDKDVNDSFSNVEYEETRETRSMRKRVIRINQALAAIDLNLHLPDTELDVLNQKLLRDPERKPIDFSRCALVRIFNNNDFKQGGRFYRGWWQEIPKQYRKYIEINGQMTAEYDFSSLHPTLIYLLEGLDPLDGAYDVDGFLHVRSLIKKAFNIMLNSSDRNSAIKAIKQKWYEIKKAESYHGGVIDIELMVKAIENKHYQVKHCFFTGVGLKLQRTDSEIAEQVMLEMLDEHKVVLPVHDSFIVEVFDKQLLKQTIQRVTKKLLMKELKIDKKEEELEIINQKRLSAGEHLWSEAGAEFITREEKGDEKDYKKYFQVRDIQEGKGK